MKYEIRNGLLIIGAQRIILSRVAWWKAEQNIIVFMVDGAQVSVQAGPETPKLDAELTTHFTTCPTTQQQ